MAKKVQIYGRHLLVNCVNVPRDLCLDDKRFLEVMAESATLAGATVVSQIRYHLGHNSPPGFACVCLLDESHISAHSYADLGLVAIDLFTCGSTDPNKVLEIMQSKLDLGTIEKNCVDRFCLPIE